MKIIKKIIAINLLVLLTCSFNLYSIKAYDIEKKYRNCNEKDSTNEITLETVSESIKANGELKVSARNAIAIDSRNNTVLWNQNGYEIVPMASTTKILTALIAISYGDLDRKVTVSKEASVIRGSTVGYKAGEEITMRELLFGLMFKSGNDAAIAIAEDIGGSVEGFANIMNDYAKSIGIIDSHFESPHGLDSQGHYSSAYDLAILTSKAMEYAEFRECVGEKSISRDKYNFTRDYQNINKILYRIPEANGVKTGYTGGAGKCLVTSVNHEGRNIIIVVLNCVDRWNVTEKIYNHVIKNTNFLTVNNKEILQEKGLVGLGKLITEEEISYGYKETDNVEVEVFNPNIDIEEGDVLGKISIKDKIEEKTKLPLVSGVDISKEEFQKIILGE